MLVTFSSTLGFSGVSLLVCRTSVTDVLFFSGSQVLKKDYFQSFFSMSAFLFFVVWFLFSDKKVGI